MSEIEELRSILERLRAENSALANRVSEVEKVCACVRLDGCDTEETMMDLWDRTISRMNFVLRTNAATEPKDAT